MFQKATEKPVKRLFPCHESSASSGSNSTSHFKNKSQKDTCRETWKTSLEFLSQASLRRISAAFASSKVFACSNSFQGLLHFCLQGLIKSTAFEDERREGLSILYNKLRKTQAVKCSSLAFSTSQNDAREMSRQTFNIIFIQQKNLLLKESFDESFRRAECKIETRLSTAGCRLAASDSSMTITILASAWYRGNMNQWWFVGRFLIIRTWAIGDSVDSELPTSNTRINTNLQVSHWTRFWVCPKD